MVKELVVDDPRPEHTQDQIDQIMWEQAYLGVEPPDWFEEMTRAKSGLAWMYEKLERSRSAMRAAAEWDLYRISVPLDDRTPRERLNEFFGRKSNG